MRYIEPHGHMVSRVTDDYEAMVLAGCRAVCEPAFWAGYDRSGPQGFYDYFCQLTDYEPKRAAKYGLMFVALAFMAVFCLELISGQRVHPVQYLFTGIALVFFYVLLLSLAEHLGFTQAYLAASIATGTMLAVYVGAAMSSVIRGLVMLVVFALTYCMLYLILQLEDYALLAGSILGFLALTLVMFVTLRVDWSGGSARQVAG